MTITQINVYLYDYFINRLYTSNLSVIFSCLTLMFFFIKAALCDFSSKNMGSENQFKYPLKFLTYKTRRTSPLLITKSTGSTHIPQRKYELPSLLASDEPLKQKLKSIGNIKIRPK